MAPPTPLSAIPTVAQLYAEGFLEPASDPSPTATARYASKLSIISQDITTLDIDAIVNAANNSLLGGGGVDGAIHRAAGPDLFDECETLEGCDTGDAKITSAYELPCKRIIHAVGPVYYSAKREGMHTTLLQSCYTRSLDLAVQNACRSIAFSALSTGIYGYPSKEACVAAIEAVKGWLEADEERAKKMDRIVFCQFMDKDQRAYEEFIPQYFTPVTQEVNDQKEDSTKDEQNIDKDAAKENPEKTTVDVAADIDTTTIAGADATTIAGADATTTADADATTQKELQTDPITSTKEASEAAPPPPTTDTLPDLPDVPTKEPALPGEPENKKPKLSQ
ncbi:related to hismacro and SEC14 domain-containing proteins [Ramularia collo-cygni]|uniref:Related to hismacro and SEC14 domain-containing proteins n=1 Tax=Ramularia collo-cygni TaxID=112498 RepID=A0A2D3V593_9PEZI|nr:related to hismacro and SEC14 domain-containing proteins [Ramularia collo-cygni]CZT19877.1 related to hismacro and SEC14 domain-containing proteins [Ramularia collo-cygni]